MPPVASPGSLGRKKLISYPKKSIPRDSRKVDVPWGKYVLKHLQQIQEIVNFPGESAGEL
jgi:hypothetical protein